MEVKVRASGGTLVEYGEEAVILDPSRNSHSYPTFVSHAHADHASAFKHPEREKYATVETLQILTAMGWKRLEGLKPVKVGDRVKLGDIEVKVHNSGHVLGSVQFEVNTPEGTVLYTGDMCTEDTFTMNPATPVDCDLMVIETTFGSPMFRFPKRKDVAVEIYNWAVETVLGGRIPAFKTDSIGNAQEIISLFNQYTKLPVVTAKNATKVTDVYRRNGFNLDSVDAYSEEGQDLLDSGKCVLVMPKGSKPVAENIETALASGWAAIMRKRHTAFPLSDHADYRSLLGFIRRCSPKRVLTFHGGSMTKDFHKHVEKTLHIPASPLTSRLETIRGPFMTNEARIRACSKQIIRTIRIPGFVYQQGWLVKEMTKKGFSSNEAEQSIDFLLGCEVLRGIPEGIVLNKS